MPADARARAATVRAVTASDATPERPLLWCIVCGALAVVALVALLHSVLSYAEGPMAVTEMTLRLVTFGATYGFGVWGFSYGWELYDTQKAARLAIVLGVSGLAILIVVAIVLLLVAGAKDLDVDVDASEALEGVGSTAKRVGRAVVDVAGDSVAPALAQAYAENTRPPWLPEAQEPRGRVAATARSASAAADTRPTPLPVADPRGVDCSACGHRFDPRDRLGCPACGHPI